MSLYSVVQAPLKRFYTFLLKKLIGDYLKDELKQHQLEVELRKGVLELKDLELAVEVLNEAVDGLPFKFVKGRVRSARVEIPWHSLSTQNCKLRLTGLALTVEALEEQDFADNSLDQSILMQASFAALGNDDMAPFVKKHLKETLKRNIGAGGKSGGGDSSSGPGSLGISSVSEVLERIVAETEVFIDDLSVRLQHRHADAPEQKISAVVLRIPHARYLNVDEETRRQAQQQQAASPPPGSESYARRSPERATAAQAAEKQFEKVLRFRGLRVDLVDTVAREGQRSTPAVTIAHADVNHDCVAIVRLTVGATGARVDCDFAVRSVRLLCSATQLAQLSAAAEALSAASRLIMKRHHNFNEDYSTQASAHGDDERPVQIVNMEGESSRIRSIDGLFRDAKSALRPGGGGGSSAAPVGRAMKSDDFQTVERLLQDYKARAQQPGGRGPLDSFVSVQSAASDEFYECSSAGGGSAGPEMFHSVLSLPDEDALPIGDAKQESQARTVAAPEARGKLTTKTWNFALRVQRLSVILFEERVTHLEWPKDIDWYLSPIPLPAAGDAKRVHPAPALCGYGRDHIVGTLDGISLSMQQSPVEPRSQLAVRRVHVLEYCRRNDRVDGPGSGGLAGFRCTQVVAFGEEQKQGGGDAKVPPSASNIDTTAERQAAAGPTPGTPVLSPRLDKKESDSIPDLDEFLERQEAIDAKAGVAASSSNAEPPLVDVDIKCDESSDGEARQARLARHMRSVREELNPDVVLSTRTILDDEGDVKVHTTIDLETRPARICMDLDTLARLRNFQQGFVLPLRPQPSPDVDDDTVSVARARGASPPPSAPLSRDASVDFYADIAPQQMRADAAVRGVSGRSSRVERETEFRVAVPRLTLRLDARGAVGPVDIVAESLELCNTVDDNDDSVHVDDDTWKAEAERIAVRLGGQDVLTVSEEELGSGRAGVVGPSGDIRRPQISLVSRPTDAQVFFPISDERQSYSADKTQEFFRDLASRDAKRVWEGGTPSASAGARRSQDRGQSEQKKRQSQNVEEWEAAAVRLARAVVRVSAPCVKVDMTRSDYLALLSVADAVQSVLSLPRGRRGPRSGDSMADAKADSKADAKADAKSDAKGRARSPPESDPALRPQHLEHAPRAPDQPRFAVPIRNAHCAYRHGTALIVDVDSLECVLVDREAKDGSSDDEASAWDAASRGDASEASGVRNRAAAAGGYSLAVRSFRLYRLDQFNGQKMTYTSLGAQGVEILECEFDESGARCAVPVLFNTLALSPDGDAARAAHMTIVSASHSQVVLSVRSLTYEMDLGSKWPKRLAGFFAAEAPSEPRAGPPPADPEPSTAGGDPPRAADTDFYVHAYDCAVDYNSPAVPSRLVVCLGRASVRSSKHTKGAHLEIELWNADAYMLQRAPKRRRDAPRPLHDQKGFSLACRHLHGITGEALSTHLERTGYLRVADMNQCALHFVWSDPARRDDAADALVPDALLEITNEQMNVYARADSLAVLLATVNRFAAEAGSADELPDVKVTLHDEAYRDTDGPDGKDLGNAVDGKERRPDAGKQVPPPRAARVVDILAAVDMDAFERGRHEPAARALREATAAYAVGTAGGALSRVGIIDDYVPAEKINADEKAPQLDLPSSVPQLSGASSTQSSKAGWHETPAVKEGHFSITDQSEGVYKSRSLQPPPGHPRPVFALKAHGINVKLRLFGGSDFADKETTVGLELLPSAAADAKRDISGGMSMTPAEDGDWTSVASTAVSTERALEAKLAAGERPGKDARMETVKLPRADEKRQGLNAYVVDENKARPSQSWPARARPTRRRRRQPHGSSDVVELDLKGMHAVLHAYGPDGEAASFLAVAIGDFDLRDGVRASVFRSLLAYDPPRGAPRETHSSMLHAVITNVRPDRGDPSRQEARARVALLPIRANIDQDTLEFLAGFGRRFGDASSAAASLAQGAQDDANDVLKKHIPDDDEAAPPEAYIQSFSIKRCSVRLDYRPKRIDLSGLRNGDYGQLAHLFALQDVRVALEAKRYAAIEGWGRLVGRLIGDWVEQVIHHQTHRYLSGIQPIRSIVNVGSGVIDLVMIPVNELRNEGRLLKGLKDGASSFLKSLAMEAIDITTSLAIGAQSLLESVDSALTAAAADKIARVHGKWRRRGAGRRDRRRGDVRMPKKRNKRAGQPSGYHDGLRQAYAALSRG